MSAVRRATSSQFLKAGVFMAVETFDQRFKRLTSDLLMLDICRVLNIEVRDLMKVRSGIRVPLNMDRLRRLCADNGLDFASFTRDYDSPWSAELKTQVITSDTQGAGRRRSEVSVKASQSPHPRFRSDGSRVDPPANTKNILPAPKKGPSVSYADRLSELAAPSEHEVDDDQPLEPQGPSVVGRLRAAVANAAAMLIADPLTDGREERRLEAAELDQANINYPEPRKIGAAKWSAPDHATIETILSEVNDLRKDVHALTKRIDELIGR